MLKYSLLLLQNYKSYLLEFLDKIIHYTNSLLLFLEQSKMRLVLQSVIKLKKLKGNF